MWSRQRTTAADAVRKPSQTAVATNRQAAKVAVVLTEAAAATEQAHKRKRLNDLSWSFSSNDQLLRGNDEYRSRKKGLRNN